MKNYAELHAIFSDNEEPQDMQIFEKKPTEATQPKKHLSREDIDLLARNQSDMETDIEREESGSGETHFHGAREENIRRHFRIDKDMDGDSWSGLYVVVSKIGALPPELRGKFTDSQTAINKCTAYLNMIKDTQNQGAASFAYKDIATND